MPRHRPHVLVRTLAAAGLALLAGACSDQPFGASPVRSPAGAARSTANPAEPPLIANAVKYAERGAKPATGRSGSAALTARALIGKDGQTVLEVTTGALDTPAPAPGTLVKLQVRQFTPKDEPLRTLNYNDLPGGGSVTYSYAGLVRGAKLQVQERAWHRPPADGRGHGDGDGAPAAGPARAAERPGQGEAGDPRERRRRRLGGERRGGCTGELRALRGRDRGGPGERDLGGRGRPVSCAFTHVFATSGTKHLRVAVTDVAPGDFEPANNSAEGTIEISRSSGTTTHW